METRIREYCALHHALTAKEALRKSAMKDAKEAQTASSKILMDLLCAGENYAGTAEGKEYSVSVVNTAPPVIIKAKEAREALDKAFNDELPALLDEWEECSYTPSSIVENIVSRLAPNAVCSSRCRLKVGEITKKLSLPRTPLPNGAGDLLEVYLSSKEAKKDTKEVHDSGVREAKEARTDAEGPIISELVAREEKDGRNLHRVSMKTSDGVTGSYFLRVKEARKSLRPQAATQKKLRRYIKNAVDATHESYATERIAPNKLYSVVRSKEFLNQMHTNVLEAIEKATEQKEAKVSEGRRLSLDKVPVRTNV